MVHGARQIQQLPPVDCCADLITEGITDILEFEGFGKCWWSSTSPGTRRDHPQKDWSTGSCTINFTKFSDSDNSDNFLIILIFENVTSDLNILGLFLSCLMSTECTKEPQWSQSRSSECVTRE